MLFASSTESLPARMVCYGASGTGVHLVHDARQLAARAGQSVEFAGYVDDIRDERRRVEKNSPVMSFQDLVQLDDVGVLVPVLDPGGRRRLYDKLAASSLPILGSRGTSDRAHPEAEIGEGTIVSSATFVGHSARIGRGCVVMAHVVAHDVVIGEFTSLAYGSIVLGHVQVGENVFIGTGAIIQNGTLARPLTIGDGAVIGAGAVVAEDVAPGVTMVGPRAQPLAEVLETRRRAEADGPQR